MCVNFAYFVICIYVVDCMCSEVHEQANLLWHVSCVPCLSTNLLLLPYKCFNVYNLWLPCLHYGFGFYTNKRTLCVCVCVCGRSRGLQLIIFSHTLLLILQPTDGFGFHTMPLVYTLKMNSERERERERDFWCTKIPVFYSCICTYVTSSTFYFSMRINYSRKF